MSSMYEPERSWFIIGALYSFFKAESQRDGFDDVETYVRGSNLFFERIKSLQWGLFWADEDLVSAQFTLPDYPQVAGQCLTSSDVQVAKLDDKLNESHLLQLE